MYVYAFFYYYLGDLWGINFLSPKTLFSCKGAVLLCLKQGSANGHTQRAV